MDVYVQVCYVDMFMTRLRVRIWYYLANVYDTVYCVCVDFDLSGW